MRYVVLLWLCGLIQVGTAASPAVILSEVMADNRVGITDAEGDNSDWIELSNTGLEAVDLSGWYLTDDLLALTRWRFPATNIAGGGRLVIFASGKNKRAPGVELHANFQLASQGETIALVRPDGVTIEDSFAYPALGPEVSFGRSASSESVQVIGNRSFLRFRVPLSEADVRLDWKRLDYDDTAWGAGVFPVGFDAIAPTNAPGSLTNLARGKSPTQSSSLSPFLAPLAVDGRSETYTHTLAGQQLPSRWEVSLRGTFLIEKITLRNRADCCASRLRDITLQVLNESGSLTNFHSSLLNPENALNSPAALVLDFNLLPQGLVSGSRVRILRTPDPDLSGGGNTGDDVDVLSMSEVEILGRPIPASYGYVIATDLGPSMSGQASSALLRAPFLLPGSEVIWQEMRLRFRYDDGFVAYLNGVEVLRRNTPTNLLWDSKSITNRSKTVGYIIETVNLSPFVTALKAGSNLFAVHLLNATQSDPDLLFAPLLEVLGARLSAPRFLGSPTPGSLNSEGFTGWVEPVSFSVPRGFQETPVDLALSTLTPGAVIRYTLDGSAPGLATGLSYDVPIRLTNTTVIRAVAFKAGFKPSVSITHSYLFLEDILRQTAQSAIASGFPNTWGSATSDYGMSARVIGQNGTDGFGGKYARTIRSDLRSIPTLSLVLNRQDFFGATGIYSQSDAHGDEFERDTSAELIDDPQGGGFQINAGLRVQGGAFRSDGLTKKHSLRLVFNSSRGPSKLRYPLFGPEGPQRFNTLTLRANSNDGYSWDAAAGQPLYARDTFGRETILDMQGVASHHRFVHLYIDGLYWGLYEMVERPDSAFSADNFGGEKEEYDSLNSGTPTEGDGRAWDILTGLSGRGFLNNSNYFAVQGRNPDGTRNPALTNYLDVENMIDYMIVNLYGGNTDWPAKNFWVARRRGPQSTGFKYFMWDSEWTLGLRSDLTTDRTVVSEAVAAAYAGCKSNPEFRILFGDHLHRHFFNGGVLAVDRVDPRWNPEHPERNQPAARLWKITREIRSALVAESARWGDMHISPGFTRDEHWDAELAQLMAGYFPQRSEAVLQQFRNEKLYPAVTAPVFSRHSGPVASGDLLGMGSPAGRIYYTLNGEDPRLLGGGISGSAVAYESPIRLPGRCVVKARAWVTNTWSALQETAFSSLDPFPIRVTEIHYRPSPEPPESGFFQDDSEFVELGNLGSTPFDLRGFAFSHGIQFQFGEGALRTVAPGGFVLVVKRRAAFEARYGAGLPIAGEYLGSLVNGGERITLTAPTGEIVQEVAYDPRWHPTTDGFGFSLVSTHSSMPASASSSPEAWRSSSLPGGSPGRVDLEPSLPHIQVTEVLSRASAANGDFIELLNASDTEADIGGWYLTDDHTVPRKYRIPANTLIAPGAYFVIGESQYGRSTPGSLGFGLSALGEEAYLFSANGAGELTGYSHGFRFGPSPLNVSWVLTPSAEGFSEVRLSASNTPGRVNGPPQTGVALLTQIYPGEGQADPPWIEIQNLTSIPLDLFVSGRPEIPWRVTGIDWKFPAAFTLPPSAFCILSSDEPARFRARWGVDDSIPVLGPFLGTLSAEGETLELQRPEAFGNAIDYVMVDRVSFRSSPPWPNVAGQGASLHRVLLGGMRNGPEEWYTANALPGGPRFSGVDTPKILEQPQSLTVGEGQAAALTVRAESEPTHRYQWFRHDFPLPRETNAALVLRSLVSGDAGAYKVRISSVRASVLSEVALLGVIKAPSLIRAPVGRRVPAGTNVSLNVSAAGIGPLRYQWIRDGREIPGAIETNLVFTAIRPEEGGEFSVRISDDWGSLTTLPVTLLAFVRPSILQQPFSQTVLEGQTVTLRVEAQGTLPMTYRWRKEAKGLTNAVYQLMSGTSRLTLASVAKAAAGTYSVSVSNVSGVSLISSNVLLVVLGDADRDGMADDWELVNGYNPSDAGDALLDADGDGVLNRDEYAAGTDPKNASSLLRFDAVQLLGTDLLLRFRAASNRNYSIFYRDGLELGWGRLVDFPAAPAAITRELRDPIQSRTGRYYRIVSPADP